MSGTVVFLDNYPNSLGTTVFLIKNRMLEIVSTSKRMGTTLEAKR